MDAPRLLIGGGFQICEAVFDPVGVAFCGSGGAVFRDLPDLAFEEGATIPGDSHRLVVSENFRGVTSADGFQLDVGRRSRAEDSADDAEIQGCRRGSVDQPGRHGLVVADFLFENFDLFDERCLTRQHLLEGRHGDGTELALLGFDLLTHGRDLRLGVCIADVLADALQSTCLLAAALDAGFVPGSGASQLRALRFHLGAL